MFRKPVVSGGRQDARRFLLALPGVWIVVPEFLLRRLLARDAKAMIEGLRREIAARQVHALALKREPVH